MPFEAEPTAYSGLDGLDRTILDALQEDGRLTNVDLARRVGLSPSPCLRRVPALLGRALQVVVMVRLTDQRQETLAAFEAAVEGIEDVMRCLLIAGDADYLLTVQVRDLDSYHALYTERLGELPGVSSLRSLVTMKAVKDTHALPV